MRYKVNFKYNTVSKSNKMTPHKGSTEIGTLLSEHDLKTDAHVNQALVDHVLVTDKRVAVDLAITEVEHLQ